MKVKLTGEISIEDLRRALAAHEAGASDTAVPIIIEDGSLHVKDVPPGDSQIQAYHIRGISGDFNVWLARDKAAEAVRDFIKTRRHEQVNDREWWTEITKKQADPLVANESYALVRLQAKNAGTKFQFSYFIDRCLKIPGVLRPAGPFEFIAAYASETAHYRLACVTILKEKGQDVIAGHALKTGLYKRGPDQDMPQTGVNRMTVCFMVVIDIAKIPKTA